MSAPLSLELWRRHCVRRGLIFENADPFSGYIAKIICPKTKRWFLIGAGPIPAYPGNDAAMTAIANDKAFTSLLMKRLRIDVPAGDYFFLNQDFADQRPPGKELDAAQSYVEAHFASSQAPLVIKPNKLSHARLVSLARNAREAMADLKTIAKADLIGHVQHLIDEPEFRLFLVRGEIAFCYRKGRPAVLGDGRSTIEALIKSVVPAADERFLDHVLRMRNLTRASTLNAGEELQIGFIANLSARGRFLGLVTPHPSLQGWARRLFAAFPLSVMGIDIFSRSALADPADYVVSDINASPALTTLHDGGFEHVVSKTLDLILDVPFGPLTPQ